MSERRPLIAGIKPTAPPVDPSREHEFVHGTKKREGGEAKSSATTPAVGRTPISTRIRSDIALALKHASLQRQLDGKEPSTLCDIMEEAIEPWLKSNGYLP